MRKHIAILLFICVSVFTACAHSRKATRKKTVKSSGSASVKSLTAVTMRRGACFGRCPEYTLTINSNGKAEYSGKRNAEPLGVYEKNIGTVAAQAMLKKFMSYRADTCSELYTSRIADVPGLYYTLRLSGRDKIINNANFGPEYLTTLAEEMDQIGKVDASWKKVRDVVPE